NWASLVPPERTTVASSLTPGRTARNPPRAVTARVPRYRSRAGLAGSGPSSARLQLTADPRVPPPGSWLGGRLVSSTTTSGGIAAVGNPDAVATTSTVAVSTPSTSSQPSRVPGPVRPANHRSSTVTCAAPPGPTTIASSWVHVRAPTLPSASAGAAGKTSR